MQSVKIARGKTFIHHNSEEIRSMLIQRYIFSQILDGASIVKVAKYYDADLKKVGSNYKTLCTVHNDTSPSLSICPKKNIARCFVCGITYTPMTYVMMKEGVGKLEAVKILVKMQGIEVKEEEETDEQKANREHIESLSVCLSKYQEFVRQQFQDPRNTAVREYAHSRWSDEQCNEAELGCAPSSSVTMNWVRKSGLNPEHIEEVGILARNGRGEVYPFFRDRIIFPVKDKYGNIIGFSARALNPEEKKFKYINTKETPLFVKGDNLFGYYEAKLTAVQENKMYLVEGIPDVITLNGIGVLNVVAPLGTATTPYQLKLIADKCKQICFIPDKDEISDGQKHGAGVINVMKVGVEAVKVGLIPFVKEIPDSYDESGKQRKTDPGEYFTDIERFNALSEQDFILWYAEKLFYGIDDSDINGKSAAFARLCEVLQMLTDEYRRSRYIDAFKKYGNKKHFKDGMKKFESTDSQSSAEKDDIITGSVFTIEDNRYYHRGQKKFVSNFVATPHFLIKDGNTSIRKYTLTNYRGETADINIPQSEFTNKGFKAIVEGQGYFIWRGNEEALTDFKEMMFAQTKTAIPVKQYGTTNEGYYAYANGIFVKNRMYYADERGIVTLADGTYFYIEAADQETELFNSKSGLDESFVYDDSSSITWEQYTWQMMVVFGDNAIIAICFMLAAVNRDIVMRFVAGFPLLYLFGPKSTGKSQFSEAIGAICMTNLVPINVRNASVSALGAILASIRNVIVCFDEYKNDIDKQKVELLKGSWDGTGRTVQGGANYKRTEATKIKGAISMTGQESPSVDDALFARVCQLGFFIATYSSEQKQELAKLQEMQEEGVTHLSAKIAMLRDVFLENFKEEYKKTQKELENLIGNEITARVCENWAVLLAASRSLRQHIALPFSDAEAVAVIKKHIIDQNKDIEDISDVSLFWKGFMHLRTAGKIVEHIDFRVIHNTKNTDGTQIGHKLLYLNPDRVFGEYSELRRRQGSKGADPESVKAYLRNNSKIFLKNGRCRFQIMENGKPKFDYSNNVSKPVLGNARTALVFKYEALRDSYGVALDTNAEELTEEETVAEEQAESADKTKENIAPELPF